MENHGIWFRESIGNPVKNCLMLSKNVGDIFHSAYRQDLFAVSDG